jgi:hypothetical protein
MIRSTRSCEKVNSEKIEDVFADVVETEEATALNLNFPACDRERIR